MTDCTEFTTGVNTARLIHGDSVNVLQELKGGYAMIVADPPYASGGSSIREKQRSTGEKYAKDSHFHDFDGDGRDQRSWSSWMAKWLGEARGLCNNGAILAVFSDWRQLPSLSDAVQWAGWLWRGIIPWDKVNPRPQIGRFKQQCEFVLWASKGAIPADRDIGVLPGLYSYSIVTGPKRLHQTEKPVPLLCDLMKICPAGGRILDPFMGSGAAIEAALIMGHDCTGIEINDYYYDVSTARIGRFTTGDGK
jgi:site-specific DNA-methyltransferase (adenine-specific)